MKKTLLWFVMAIVNIIVVSSVSSYISIGNTEPSKYESKIVKEIKFLSIYRTKSGKLKIGELKTADPDDLVVECITEVGFPLKSSDVRKDIQAVFKAGKFSDVIVEAEDLNEGVRLRFLCEERPIIKDIRFKGTEEVQNNELRQFLPFKEFDPLREDLIEASIERLKSKYFENGYFNCYITYKVDIDDDNNATVTFRVDEGEEIKVAKISLLGAKKIPDHELRAFMLTKERGSFSGGEFKEFQLEQDKQKLMAYYRHKGYLDAEIIEQKVEYKWRNPEEMLEREIYITLKIKEGERYYFDGYTVKGNKLFTEKELRNGFKLGRAPKRGSERLIKMFEEMIAPNKGGDTIFDDQLFQMDKAGISFKYSSKGYIFARIIPRRTITERVKDLDGKKVKRKYVHYDFTIIEGKKAYVENIVVKGNTKTEDKVIRREVLLKEGELFDSSKMQISREKIYALGFFKEVNVDLRPGSKNDQMNLIISVEEQPTGTISLGGGYSTGSGFSIFATVGEKNWNGKAQDVNVRVEYGPLRSSVSLNFSDPWLFNMFDRPIGFDASIFYTLYDIETDSVFSNSDEEAIYRKQSFGYSLGVSRKFLRYHTLGIRWSHSFQSILEASGNCDDDIFEDMANGFQEKRRITPYIMRNTKNHPLNPTRGSSMSLSMSFVGGYLLGGDDHYVKYKPDLYFYFSPFHLPFLDDFPTVVELRANAVFLMPPFNKSGMQDVQDRFADDWLEEEDRVYLGGPETLRGWEALDDNDFPESWQRRQFHRITYGAEFRLPVHTQFLWLVAFFDAGSLWSDEFWEETLDSTEKRILRADKANGLIADIRDINDVDLMSYFKYSYGFGLKINVPMMPLRFWFGKKLKWVGRSRGLFKEISGYNFQFSIGDMRF